MAKRIKRNKSFASSSRNALLALLVVAAAFAVYGIANAAVISHQGSEIIGKVGSAATADDALTLQLLSRASLEAKLTELTDKLGTVGAAGSPAQSLSETFSVSKSSLTQSGTVAATSTAYPVNLNYAKDSVKLMDLPSWVDARSNCQATVQQTGFIQAEWDPSPDNYATFSGGDGNIDPVIVEKNSWESTSGGAVTAFINFNSGSGAKTATIKQTGIRRCASFLHDPSYTFLAFLKSSTSACKDTMGQIVTDSNVPVLYGSGSSHTHSSGCSDAYYQGLYPTNTPACSLTGAYDGMRYARETTIPDFPDSCGIEFKPGSVSTPGSVWVNMRSSQLQPSTSACSVKITCQSSPTFGSLPAFVGGGGPSTCREKCSNSGLNPVCVAANTPNNNQFQIACNGGPDVSTSSGCWCTN